MRGGLVGRLLSLLRHPLDRNDVTAKRVLNDSPVVAEERRDEEIRRAAQKLFPREYLEARGLTGDAADEHDARVFKAIGALLACWDEFATAMNHMDPVPEQNVGLVALALGFPLELALRAAAYVVLYDRHHPAFASVGYWLPGNGIASWYRDMSDRAGNLLKVNQLARAAGVECVFRADPSTCSDVTRALVPGRPER